MPPEHLRVIEVAGLAAEVVHVSGEAGPSGLGGLPAWLLWLGVHIVYLIGFRNRIKVLVDWGWSYFTSRGAEAILVHMPEESLRQVGQSPDGGSEPTTAWTYEGSEPRDVPGK